MTQEFDFISQFMAYTEGTLSPPIFRQWCAVSCLAASVERRVYTITSLGTLYPNMFVVLVGSPGSGKTVAVDFAMDLWRNARYNGDPNKRFHMAPKRMTRAGLIDALFEADRKLLLTDGQIHVGANTGLLEFHSLIVPSPEFGILISAHDLDFLSTLNDIFDNPVDFGEKLRWVNGGKTKEIIAPQVNILAGTQPSFLGTVMPEAAWGQGFTSRLIMIYASTVQEAPQLFVKRNPRVEQRQQLLAHISEMSKLVGQIEWDDAAAGLMQELTSKRFAPEPEHYRLQHYNSRRMVHMLKLGMISSLSRGTSMVVTEYDVKRGLDILHRAETVMPDIFREMETKSDTATLTELHLWMYRLYTKDKKPIHRAKMLHQMTHFFQVPADKVDRIISIAERSNMVARQAGTQDYFVPRPREGHGVIDDD